jgi:hypothetical protein
MVKIISYFIFVFVIIIGCKYQSKTNQVSQLVPTVEETKACFLGKNIKDCDCFKAYFHRIDTIFEGDEGISWPGAMYFENNTLMFVVESNWVTPERISRITIVHPKIKTETGIGVGNKMNKIKMDISNNIPSSPDGELCLLYKSDHQVRFLMDISNDSKLFYGAMSIEEIPDDIQLDEIIVLDEK